MKAYKVPKQTASYWKKQYEAKQANFDRLAAQIKPLGEALEEYSHHLDHCILTFWEGGEPTKDGGYRMKYAGEWYQKLPVDETPKCDCGLSEALSRWRKDGK